MSRLLLTAAVLAVLIYSMVLGVRWLTPRIEQDIANRVTSGLAEQGLLWADVTVKGREVVLSGVAPSTEAHDKAVAVAGKVFGVAKISDELTVAIEDADAAKKTSQTAAKNAKPYTLSIVKDGDKVVLEGEVSSEADKAVLLRLANNHYGERHVDVTKLVVVEGAPAGWRSAAGTVLVNITNLEKASVTLSNTEVMVSGSVLDKQFSEQMEQAVKTTLPETYKAAFAVEVVTPTIIGAAESAVEDAVGSIEPAAGDAKVCAALDDVKKERLRFDFDKAELMADHMPVLKKVAGALKGCADEHLVVAGFTDVSGSPLYNKWLSQQRAEAAMRGLMRDGVKKDRLKAVGYGDAHPEADNATKAGRVLNRRVEFHPGAELPFSLVEKAAAAPEKKQAKPHAKKAAAKPKTVSEIVPAAAEDSSTKISIKVIAVSDSAIRKPWWAKPVVSETTSTGEKWLGDTN